ncbi:hypothetical protein C440_09652 [Haloferax mucosum ATCC BAA-1512]|uniref:Uncharacterized protein n=1 Tax=Haloferax mucosum ATCC BAA-1512 TaxID=662479 RepID=M0IHJ3_9EURY|nr:hypothetical protein [Haloferax mucosum]ELZ95333.1 hypothetical protein C440_09652 [Haloferax mucosum ATCC BAA-1512]
MGDWRKPLRDDAAAGFAVASGICLSTAIYGVITYLARPGATFGDVYALLFLAFPGFVLGLRAFGLLSSQRNG